MIGRYLLCGVVASILWAGCSEGGVNKIVFYKMGVAHHITDQEKLHTIEKNISKCLGNIDDVLKMILTPSQIDEVIHREDGVEILYSEEQKASLADNGRSIPFNKIYIPLSGKYAGLGIVYFFGGSDGYGGLPPYISKDGLTGLKSIVEKNQ